MLGEEISNLSGNQTAVSEQRGGKERNIGETKPKLTPFVIENIQYRESSPLVRVARGTTLSSPLEAAAAGDGNPKLLRPRSGFPSHWWTPERARGDNSHHSAAASFWQQALRCVGVAHVIKKLICWGRGRTSSCCQGGQPLCSPTGSGSEANNSLHKKSPAAGRNHPCQY